MTPRVVNENASHYLRGDREELRAVGKFCARLVDETKVGLVNERGG
jgi:hypothetical protein